MYNRVLLGSLMGDASISRMFDKRQSTFNYRFEVEHCVDQQDLSNMIRNVVSEMEVNVSELKIRHRTTTIKGRKTSGTSVRWYSCSNKVFKPYRELMYSKTLGRKIVTREILNMLEEDGLLIWYFDDGSYHIHRNTIHLNTQCFGLGEHHVMQKFFKDRYDIDVSIVKKDGLYSLYFPLKEAHKFLKVVSRSVYSYPKTIPTSMMKKIPYGWDRVVSWVENPVKRSTKSIVDMSDWEVKRELLDSLHSFAKEYHIKELHGFPIIYYNRAFEGRYSYKSFQKAFGSMRGAIIEAGLPSNWI